MHNFLPKSTSLGQQFQIQNVANNTEYGTLLLGTPNTQSRGINASNRDDLIEHKV
jgi:hypothetical protein